MCILRSIIYCLSQSLLSSRRRHSPASFQSRTSLFRQSGAPTAMVGSPPCRAARLLLTRAALSESLAARSNSQLGSGGKTISTWPPVRFFSGGPPSPDLFERDLVSPLLSSPLFVLLQPNPNRSIDHGSGYRKRWWRPCNAVAASSSSCWQGWRGWTRRKCANYLHRHLRIDGRSRLRVSWFMRANR